MLTRPQQHLCYHGFDHNNDYFAWWRDGDWKLIYSFEPDRYELYNLRDDPSESNDRSATETNRLVVMAQAMSDAFESGWGERGTLWPAVNPSPYEQYPARPLGSDDPMVLPDLSLLVNLLENGGFDDYDAPTDAAKHGDLTPISWIGFAEGGGQLPGIKNDIAGHSGDWHTAFFGNDNPVTDATGIYQAFDTITGTTYVVSFHMRVGAGTGTQASLKTDIFAGSPVITDGSGDGDLFSGIHQVTGTSWTLRTCRFTATSSNATIRIQEPAGVNSDNMRPGIDTVSIGPVSGTPLDVYLFGGQSNMQGSGTVADLTDALKQPMFGVTFWNGTAFETLDPGTTMMGSTLTSFGPEVGFGRFMRSATTGRDIAFIKYANSGKPLDSGWDWSTWVGDPPAPGRVNFYPGETAADANIGTLYTAMLNTFSAGLADLDANRRDYEIKGLAWVQGEQDAKHATSAGRYAENLARLNRRLEQDLNLSTGALEVAYAQVLGMPDGLVPTRFVARTAARQSMANADADSGHATCIATAHMVPTDGLNYEDVVHFNTSGHLILGTQLAKALRRANGESIPPVPVEPAAICVNRGITVNDNNSVNVNETAGGNTPPGSATGGEFWNHVVLRDSAQGTPTNFTFSSQGGSTVTLRDRTGEIAATLTPRVLSIVTSRTRRITPPYAARAAKPRWSRPVCC